MFHHSMSRNQRTKGFTVKKTVQVALFLAVTLWLLYQIKHSFDKKADYAVEDQKKFPIGDGVVQTGHKGKTGLENIRGMDRDRGDDGESAERKDIGQVERSKQTLGEGTGDNHDSQEDTANNGEKQTKRIKEHQGTKNVDNDFNRKSEDEETKKDTAKGKEEVLQLPSKTDGHHSSDPVENGKRGKSTNEETTSSATGHSTTAENAKQNSDPGQKVDQLDNNATPGAEPSSNTPVDTQTLDGDANKRGAVGQQESIASDPEVIGNGKVEQAASDAKSNTPVDTQTSEGDTNKSGAVGSQEGIASDSEVNGNSKAEQAGSHAKSDSQTNASPTKDGVPTEDNAMTRKVGDEVPTEDNGKTKKGSASDAQNSGNQTMGDAANDTKSEEELSGTLSPNPENNRVMPTNYEASIKDSVDTHADTATHPDSQQKTLPTDAEQKSSGEINSQSGQKNDPSVKVS